MGHLSCLLRNYSCICQYESMVNIRQNWILFVIVFSLILLSIIIVFLYSRLDRNQQSPHPMQLNPTNSACGQLPQFEFLHVYEPINQSRGRFSFEKIGHLCSEQIDPISGQESLLYLTYNTGTSYERIRLPARIIVSTQVDPTCHGMARLGSGRNV
jgi:hypothetical protein